METISNDSLEKISRFSLSSKFENELEFSKYLSENMEILDEKIPNIDFTEIEAITEDYIGEFRVDISGQNIIIENQFGESDHDHLGKIMVYFGNRQVDTAIWICEAARAEHIKAVQWLNERSRDEENFYLLEAKIIQIGDSPFAIDFDTIVSPEQFRELGRNYLKSRDRKWKNILSKIKEKTLIEKSDLDISRPGKEYVKVKTIYGKDVHYEWLIWDDGDGKYWIDVALHLEQRDSSKNIYIYNELMNEKAQIITIIGEEIKFDDEDPTFIQIYVNRELEYDKMDSIIQWAVDKMIIFYDTVNPILNEIMRADD